MVKEDSDCTVAQRIVEALKDELMVELYTELQDNHEWSKICMQYELEVRPSWFAVGSEIVYGYDPDCLVYDNLQELAQSDLEGDAFVKNCNVYCAMRLVQTIREHCHDVFFVQAMSEHEILFRVMK